MSLKYSQDVFIIPEACVTTKIMCYLCSRMSPRWKDEYLGKGKVNLKTEIEVLKMGSVLATKEAHFVCKSKCYWELLKHRNSREKLKGITQNFKVAIQSSGNNRVKRMSKIKGDTTTRIASDLPKPEFGDNSSRREERRGAS